MEMFYLKEYIFLKMKFMLGNILLFYNYFVFNNFYFVFYKTAAVASSVITDK